MSGIEQEVTILMLYPDAYKPENRAILLVKETNAHIKIWDGEKLTKDKASRIFGIARVEWVHHFETQLQYIAFEADGLFGT